MRIGLTGSSMNNRDFLSGSAVPMVGLMEALKKEHTVFWLERNPDKTALKFSPVPVIDLQKESINQLPSRLNLDLIIIQTWTAYPTLLARVFQKWGTKVFFWDDNTPYAMKITLSAAKYADLILTHGDGAKKILKKYIKDVPIEVFYFATDPERFKPEKNPKFQADVAFVGTHMRERTTQLQWIFFEPACLWQDKKFVLYGNSWGSWPKLKNYPVCYKGWADNQDLNKIFANALISINATKRRFRAVELVPSNRIFDVMSSGGVLLSDPLPGIENLFQVGKELFIAHNKDEAVALMRSLFRNPRQREEVAYYARKAILQKHTWHHRTKQLIDLFKSLPK